jgi:hypothetical protein
MKIFYQNKIHILCAAIWYKELPLKKDDFPVGFCRPINCDTGIVFCGHRHHNCLYQKVALTGLADHESGKNIQGFLTDDNRFVDRKEALKIALKANQVDSTKLGNSLIGLFSEDLY